MCSFRNSPDQKSAAEAWISKNQEELRTCPHACDQILIIIKIDRIIGTYTLLLIHFSISSVRLWSHLEYVCVYGRTKDAD